MGLTSLSLGNFSVVNGKPVLFGAGGSGLNSQALIESLVQAKSQPAFALQQQIDKGNKVAAALGQFQQLLSAFKSAAKATSNPPGVGNAAENAFNYNSVSLSSNTDVAASTYASVSASPGALIQNFAITYITSLAASTKQTSTNFAIADADTTGLVVASGAVAGQFNAGTITVEGATITLDTNDTLNSIAAKFNNVSNQTLFNASVVKVSDGNFVLNFNGIKTGSAYGFDLDSPVSVTSDISGVLSQIDFTDNQLAANAEFKIDGIAISRANNSISDALSGVTITLNKVMPDDPMSPPLVPTTVTASVQADIETAHNSIIGLANAYNAIKEFAAQQTQLKADGTYDSNAVLATNSLFRNTVDNIVSQITSAVVGIADGDPDVLAEIGITLTNSPATPTTPEVKNIMTIDDVAFTAALQSNYSGVRNLFEFDFNTTSTHLAVFKRTNALATTAFTLDANPFASQVTENISVTDADTVIAFDAPTEGQLGTGVITINGQTITITNTDTLNTIATKFNAVEASSGLHVDVTNTGTGTYTLDFTATRKNGQPNLFDISSDTQDPSGVFNHIGTITATGVFEATYDNGAGPTTIALDGSKITSTGTSYLLKGLAGTVLEGLQLVYGSPAAEESDVTISQGIADKLFNTLEGVLNTVTGSLKVEFDSIQEKANDLTTQIDKITEQVEKFREQQLVVFGLLEAALNKVNQLLFALDANEKAKQAFSN
jgi:flagellar hook-associated protein 2